MAAFVLILRPSIEMKWRWIIQSRKDNATYSAPPPVNTSMEFVFLCGSKLLCFAVDLTSGWWKKVAWRAKLLLHYRVKRRQKRLSEMHTVTSCRGNPWLSYPCLWSLHGISSGFLFKRFEITMLSEWKQPREQSASDWWRTQRARDHRKKEHEPL